MFLIFPKLTVKQAPVARVFNPSHAKFVEWTCPALKLEASIVKFQGYQDGDVELNSQWHRALPYHIDTQSDLALQLEKSKNACNC